MSATSDSTLADPEQIIGDLQRQLVVCKAERDEALGERDEALAERAAIAEVLQVINSSPGDLAPVFDAILEKAVSLTEAVYAHLWRFDGEHFHPWRSHGEAEFGRWFEHLVPVRPNPDGDGFLGRVARGEQVLYIADVRDTEAYRSGYAPVTALADVGGGRSVLTIALRKDHAVLGVLTVYRREVKQFSEKQISLLQNFAAQAVIAMENARLLTETREALEQQTATAEVLQVINSSPDDLAPVFDAMLEKAMRLCGADFGVMNRYDGKHFYHAADHGVPSAYARYRRERGPITYGSGTTPARLVAGENLIHTVDLMATEAYERGEPARKALVDLGVARTHLTAALRKGDVLLGDISIYRQEVQPFTDKQIALLQNFAAQAVIAMENARLLTETREALDQQTATAEVLQVINTSPGELQPVFEAILEKAHKLCGVVYGALVLREGEIFRAMATHSYSGSFAEQLRQGYRGADNPITRSLIGGEQFHQILDLAQIDHPMVRASFEQAGVRTGLYVPLRRDGVLLGMISACRRKSGCFLTRK